MKALLTKGCIKTIHQIATKHQRLKRKNLGKQIKYESMLKSLEFYQKGIPLHKNLMFYQLARFWEVNQAKSFSVFAHLSTNCQENLRNVYDQGNVRIERVQANELSKPREITKQMIKKMPAKSDKNRKCQENKKFVRSEDRNTLQQITQIDTLIYGVSLLTLILEGRYFDSIIQPYQL